MKKIFYLLPLLIIALSACQEDDDPGVVNLLDTPLSTTPYGFSGTVGGVYYYGDDIDPPTTSTNQMNNAYYHEFHSVAGDASLNQGTMLVMGLLKSSTEHISDSLFFSYFKTGAYTYLNDSIPPDTSQTFHVVALTSALGGLQNGTQSNYASNELPDSYLNVIDTLHTTYNGQTAIKVRAQFKCKLYNNNASLSRVIEGVFVGPFIKP